jgi:hypothetical protein
VKARSASPYPASARREGLLSKLEPAQAINSRKVDGFFVGAIRRERP